MTDGVVTDFAHEVRACALGQASSSVMANHVVGATAEEIRTARADMLAMLTAGGDGPSGRFEEMRYLRPVRDYQARHASTMLTFEAVVDAIGPIETRAAQPLPVCDVRPARPQASPPGRPSQHPAGAVPHTPGPPPRPG